MAVLVEIRSHRHFMLPLPWTTAVFHSPQVVGGKTKREQKMEFRLFHRQILPQIFAMRAKVSGSCSLSSARTKG